MTSQGLRDDPVLAAKAKTGLTYASHPPTTRCRTYRLAQVVASTVCAQRRQQTFKRKNNILTLNSLKSLDEKTIKTLYILVYKRWSDFKDFFFWEDKKAAFKIRSDYSHTKMYNVGFRAFVNSHIKCIRFVSARSSLPCISIGVRIELTFKITVLQIWRKLWNQYVLRSAFNGAYSVGTV